MKRPNAHFLSQSERSSLESQQRRERDKNIADRIRVILLLDNGWSFDKVATAYFFTRDTVVRYYSSYIEGGVDALTHTNYKGKSSSLNKEQLEQVRLFVKQHIPPSSIQVVEFIQEAFSVQYSISAVTHILHKLGFTYKKPKLVPGKADEEQQKKFLEDLEAIEDSLEDDDKLIYMDGVHPQHNSKPAYAWMEKGVETLLKANSGRQRININGALDAKNLDVTIHIDESVNAQSTIELFKKLELRYPQAKRIVVISDNARYYRSKLVSEYVTSSPIELVFLPPYAPNLNLIERLWGFMNKKVRNNKYYPKFDDFKLAINTFFQKIPKYKDALSQLLVKKFHIIRI